MKNPFLGTIYTYPYKGTGKVKDFQKTSINKEIYFILQSNGILNNKTSLSNYNHWPDTNSHTRKL